MKTRRIQAADMHSALREVRRTLGTEAIILDTRELSEGIEIIAAAGRGAAAGPRKRPPAPRPAPAAAVRDPAPVEVTLGRLDVLNINQDLDRLGMSADVRKDLLERLDPGPGVPWVNAPVLLARSLPALNSRLLKQGGRIAVLGSTGVGKTTTIAKIAAHFARLHGAGEVALINTDCHRIGAAEQLRRYGRLMGVAVHQLADAAGLEALLQRLAQKRLVLIDTVGNSHEDPVLTRQLQACASGTPALQCCLALSFNTQMAALEKTVRNFSRLPLLGTVLTKEDEAVNMGPALSIVLRHRLPVAFVTTGVRVPADLRIRSAEQLVRKAFSLADEAPVRPFSTATQSPRTEAR